MDQAEGDAYLRITETWTELDAWRERLSSVGPPPPGSELADDDTDHGGWPSSTLARGGLAAATDHLQAYRIHLEARNVFPFATGTLLRGALVGASQAVWILHPENRENRVKRARLLTQEMTHKHLQHLNDLREIAAEPHANTEDIHAHVKTRFAEIKALRTADNQYNRFNNTEIIEDATEATFGPKMRAEARTEWRRLSGCAHGLTWATLGRESNVVTPTDDPDTVEIQTGGSLTDFLNPFLLAHHITKRGWELLDLRSRS